MRTLIAYFLFLLPSFGQALPIRSVKDHGAICNGVTDDRLAIQAAIDATAGGTLYLAGTACAVSAPGVFLYPANSGMTLIGTSSSTNFGGSGGGLIAYKPSPPTVILTQFAQTAKLQNILFDCNGRAATNGIVNVMGLAAVWDHVTTRHCAGDGAQANQYATPTTVITAGGTVGSRAVSVAAVTNNRLTFGSQVCSVVVFDYGTANAEQLATQTVTGSTLNLSGPLIHAHTNVRCSGNLGFFHASHYSGIGNGGWGWRVVPGSDNGAIWWENGLSSGNASGGELWCGSVHKHYGGDYQGDGGPAVQLGDTTGACTTNFMTVAPLGDIEEGAPAYNSVVAVCDNSSRIEFTLPSFLTITSGTAACPVYAAGGSTTTGIGTDNNRQFIVKNSGGTIEFRPGAGGAINFYDSTHTLLSTLSVSDIRGLGAGKPITDFARAQLEANGGPTTTVSKLPPACTEGDRRFVMNAASATFNDIAVDAGAHGNHVPVFCDDSHVWRIG